MISFPMYIISVLVAFIGGGVVDHFIETKVRNAVADKLQSVVNDVKPT